jgi:hypothetical protein
VLFLLAIFPVVMYLVERASMHFLPMELIDLNQKEAEYTTGVNKLLSKVAAWEYDDYYTGMSIVREFEEFAILHGSIVNRLTISETESIRSHLKQMKEYNRRSLKKSHFNSAKVLLESDIKELKFYHYEHRL